MVVPSLIKHCNHNKLWTLPELGIGIEPAVVWWQQHDNAKHCMSKRDRCPSSFHQATYIRLYNTGLILHEGNEGDCHRAPWPMPWCPWNATYINIYNVLIRSLYQGERSRHNKSLYNCAQPWFMEATKAIASMPPGHCLGALEMLQILILTSYS